MIRRSHSLLSIHVIIPLDSLRRLVHPTSRRALLAYREGMRFRSAAAAWTEQQKRDWTLRRLRDAVRRAATDTTYYRELFKRIGFDPWTDFSYKDFSQLPVLEREDVHRADLALVSASIPCNQLRRDATGGSTGTPTHVWLGPEELGWRESGIEYYMRRLGLPRGTRLGFLWGHHLDPVRSDKFRDRARDFRENIRWFDCFRLSPERLRQYHIELQRWQPPCIVAYATALAALAEEVQRHGWSPKYPTHCFVTGAEKLMPHDRATIEATFSRPIHERYGGRDVGLIGFQVNGGCGRDFEIDWPNLLIEPETESTQSSILITKLHADAMPMLRYRVGDIGYFAEGAKPGHPAFTLQEILGRQTDRIWLPTGAWIQGSQLPHIMKDYPVREYQLVQSADLSVLVRVIPRDGFTENSRHAILRTLAANLPGISLAVHLVNEIPRTRSNKQRPVLSEVDGRAVQVLP